MKPRAAPAFAFSQPLLLWSTLALKTLQMSGAAAQVIALRGARMAAAGVLPGPADRREFARMGSEKVDAFTRAAQALATGALPFVAGMAGQTWRTSAQVCAAGLQLAASRTPDERLRRQRALAETLLRHAPVAHQRAAATAAARLAHRALEPVHAVATANARRLAKPQ